MLCLGVIFYLFSLGFVKHLKSPNLFFNQFREFPAIFSSNFFSAPFSLSCPLGYHLHIYKATFYYLMYHKSTHFLNLSLGFLGWRSSNYCSSVPPPYRLLSSSSPYIFHYIESILFRSGFSICFLVLVVRFPFFAQIPPFVH